MTNPIVDPIATVPPDAMTPLVHLDSTPNGAVTVWINRPAKKNAFDAATIAALHEAFETLHGAEGVRIVFLRGVGGAFRLALIARPSTSRVWAGSMMPSSHRRAVAWYGSPSSS